MDSTTRATLRKDIFNSVISNGSVVQKERWQDTCDKAAKWVFEERDPAPAGQTKKTKK